MIIRTVTWLFLLVPALSIDLSTIKFPAGVSVRKIKNLMAVVDPKSCGCARPDQHCEVPVPEARYVGFTCRVGTFCCRYKRRPNPVSPVRRISQTLSPTTAVPTTKTVPDATRPSPLTTITSRPTTTTTSPDGKTPYFDHSLPERVVTRDNLQPHHLGLPKGIRAFIRPVSQITKRVLQVNDHTKSAVESPVCRCEHINTCPAEKRDYITFRKSCPFGQVQCCREFGDVTGIDNLILLPLGQAPLQLSGIRPVHLPISLVPTTTTTTTTTTTSTTELETTTTESSTPTTIEPTPAVTTPAAATLFSATPHTVVSSTYTVTKLVWQTANINGHFGEKILQKPPVVKNYDPNDVSILNTQSTSSSTTTETTSTTTTTTTTTTTATTSRSTTPTSVLTSTTVKFPARKPVIILPSKQIPHRQQQRPNQPPPQHPHPHPHPRPLLPQSHPRPLPPQSHPRPQAPHPHPRPQHPRLQPRPQHAEPVDVGKFEVIPAVGGSVFLGSQRPSSWPRPFMQAPPPPRTISHRADTGHQDLGFVETVGQTAIDVAKTLFSWPF